MCVCVSPTNTSKAPHTPWQSERPGDPSPGSPLWAALQTFNVRHGIPWPSNVSKWTITHSIRLLFNSLLFCYKYNTENVMFPRVLMVSSLENESKKPENPKRKVRNNPCRPYPQWPLATWHRDWVRSEVPVSKSRMDRLWRPMVDDRWSCKSSETTMPSRDNHALVFDQTPANTWSLPAFQGMFQGCSSTFSLHYSSTLFLDVSRQVTRLPAIPMPCLPRSPGPCHRHTKVACGRVAAPSRPPNSPVARSEWSLGDRPRHRATEFNCLGDIATFVQHGPSTKCLR